MFAVVLLALLISVPVRAELRDPNNSADYIILTNQEVLSNNAWIDSLLDYRTAQGRVSMAVTVEEIWVEFTPQGSETAIREFLHYVYDNWQAPRLKDVFIVGHVDVVPTRQHTSPIFPLQWFYSDYAYAFDSNAPEAGPLFRVGRLPWALTNGSIVPNYFGKARTYEAQEQDLCNNPIQLIAGANETFRFEEIAENLASLFVDYPIERDYIGRAPGDSAFGDPEEILTHLAAGPLATFVFDVCGAESWGTSGVEIGDVTGFANAPCYSIYAGMTSDDLGRGDSNESIMGNAVINPEGGAIAAFSNTDVPWWYSGQTFEYQVAGALADPFNYSIGDVWESTVDGYIETYGYSEGTQQWETLFTSILLGDPATIIPGRTTSVDPIVSPVVPSTIQIVGNYPNPFNPSTTINFMLNRAGSARLAVFDITGRAVTTLAEQSFTAGQHSIVWNAAGLASGIYLVRLESGGQFDTHKITLLK